LIGADGTDGTDPPLDLPIEGFERFVFVGHGGAASVYSAVRSEDSAPVAVKVFDVAEPGQFERQVAAAERLADRAGVLALLSQGGLPDGRRYLVMPFASGGSLADHLRRFGAMAPGRVAELGASIASSLHGAHTAGVLHRDLKPSNVLVDASGTPVLSDFGAAGTTDAATASATMTVTVIYAAPEVLEGAPATERSDIYSLGLTLQALATGGHPFGGSGSEGLATIVNRICSVGPPDPVEAGVPVGLAAVLRRATAIDPDDRYPDAGAFAAALEAVAGDLHSPPDDESPRRGSPSGSRRRLALASVGVLVALAAAGIGLAMAVSDGSDAKAEPSRATTTRQMEAAATGHGLLGPLFQEDRWTYVAHMTEECGDHPTRAAMLIHADQDDRKAGVDTPWEAAAGERAGAWFSYLPCEAGGTEVRFTMRAPGRWFAVVATFPQDQYDEMVQWSRENETSPAPDFSVDVEHMATLRDEANYDGWAMVDRPT